MYTTIIFDDGKSNGKMKKIYFLLYIYYLSIKTINIFVLIAKKKKKKIDKNIKYIT